METIGFLLNIPGKRNVRFFGTFAQYTADKLGLNEAFGLVTSFNSDVCCALCYATRNEMRCFFSEHEFEMRTVEKYQQDLEAIMSEENERITGIKNFCVLNQLLHYHITNNWINDPMHTIAEGIIPWVLGCVLFFFQKKNNFRIQCFFSTSKVIRQHQPKPFSAIQTRGKGLKPNLTAAENLALFQHFLLIFSQFVDLKSKPWRLLLQLQEIIDIILAPKITEGMLAHFATQYAEFSENFSALYPDVSIRPKMHFLVHYPTIIRKNGVPKNFSVFNYERMNGAVKKPAHTI